MCDIHLSGGEQKVHIAATADDIEFRLVPCLGGTKDRAVFCEELAWQADRFNLASHCFAEQCGAIELVAWQEDGGGYAVGWGGGLSSRGPAVIPG